MLQKTALQILKLGHTAFLTGPAGAGKSFVLREYITYLKKHNIKYAVTASTGIASTHINGQTIHSWSGMGIKKNLNKYDIEALEEKKNIYKNWTETKVLIIDEVSMLDKNSIQTLDKIAKSLRRNTLPFGGLQIIFSGDFFQLPPVMRDFSKEDFDEEGNENFYAFNSIAWKEAKPVICYLTEQHRQEDDDLSLVLNAIRNDSFDEMHFEILQNRFDKKLEKEHIKLYTHNVNVDEINNNAFEKISADEFSFEMIKKGKGKLLESLKNNCLAEENLRLKIGAKVICIKNDREGKYMNGSMGVVKGFDKKEGFPIIKLNNGREINIKQDSWKIEDEGSVKAEIVQIPLKHAWAITIHKSQGMTLEMAEIDLSRAFGSGMGYVALSRLKNISGLNLKGVHPNAFQISEIVRREDSEFRKKPNFAEEAIKKYPEKELTEMHNSFILKSGGDIEEQDMTEEAVAIQTKKPSHILTKELLDGGKDIQEIAKIRNLTEGSIIEHIEKLIDEKIEIDLEKLLPPKKDLNKIISAFKKLNTKSLKLVYEELNGKFEYNTIRLVRIFIKNMGPV